MEAVLYISHGSRKKEAASEAVQFLQSVHQKINSTDFEICFLELARPDVLEGVERLVKRGADQIVVQPVLLLSAGHYFKDIPDELAKAKSRYPDVHFYYGKPLGVQDRIVDVLVDRIHESGAALDEDTHLLLVGRGSRHPDTKRSMETIADRLGEKTAHSNISVCYLAALDPRFDEGLQHSLQKSQKTVIVPYLWFTGLLVDSIDRKVETARQNGHDVRVVHYLNDHPHMIEAVADEVKEAIKKEPLLFERHSL
ncbi:sirohydrochlorin chelatase [Halobacillus litoralis]|uniref:sirohydrochlorin chelatase n=1 Tax=Halobacillus litoralis TaxID=45668 RepID=UPI001CFED737|nr:sirohydrochlorin chelatase [Halobacillus litoralis]